VSSIGTILVGCFGDVAWIRVNGEASLRNSSQVRDFADRMIEQHEGQRFVVDLEDCPGMDSTFMGTLTSIVLTMAKKGYPGAVEIINANDRNVTSLRKLGLTALIDLDEDGSSWSKERDLVASNVKCPLTEATLNKTENTQLMIDAHEALVEANEKNISQFKDVIDFLRDDLPDSA